VSTFALKALAETQGEHRPYWDPSADDDD